MLVILKATERVLEKFFLMQVSHQKLTRGRELNASKTYYNNLTTRLHSNDCQLRRTVMTASANVTYTLMLASMRPAMCHTRRATNRCKASRTAYKIMKRLEDYPGGTSKSAMPHVLLHSIISV